MDYTPFLFILFKWAIYKDVIVFSEMLWATAYLHGMAC